jgi:hypothetical protein
VNQPSPILQSALAVVEQIQRRDGLSRPEAVALFQYFCQHDDLDCWLANSDSFRTAAQGDESIMMLGPITSETPLELYQRDREGVKVLENAVPQPVAVAPTVVSTPPAAVALANALNCLVKTGRTKSEAVRAVIEMNPSLYERYLHEGAGALVF